MSKTKKIALCGVLSGLAFGLSYIEMLLPSIGIVGAKLGLANLAVLKKTDKFSPVGVSIAGGVGHNLGQILAALLMLGTGVLGYLPMLIILGAISGAIIGAVAALLIKALKKAVKA
ncbi:MAG: Gx transporter family protein [Oscillospiraceae bacterium]|nr:Gx transporter family protein [Oscillospiraceae bacterium]